MISWFSPSKGVNIQNLMVDNRYSHCSMYLNNTYFTEDVGELLINSRLSAVMYCLPNNFKCLDAAFAHVWRWFACLLAQCLPAFLPSIFCYLCITLLWYQQPIILFFFIAKHTYPQIWMLTWVTWAQTYKLFISIILFL